MEKEREKEREKEEKKEKKKGSISEKWDDGLINVPWQL